MAADRDHDIRQLLKAYRSGLITEQLFEEQMRGLADDVDVEDGVDRGHEAAGDAGPSASQSTRTYSYNGGEFTSERALILRFLDDFRAAESFGACVLALWADVARHPMLRGGLRTICARERSHGELLQQRLQQLGGECTAELGPDLRRAAEQRLASAEVADVDKLKDVVARYPDIETAVKPIRDVIGQIEEDLETRALLSTILDDELATLRWMAASFCMLRGGRPEA
jgi:hypothetical protein